MLAKLTICKPKEVGAEDRQRWADAGQATIIWNSPFLHPQFAVLVAEQRPDTRVLIAEDQKGHRAWFAFHRYKGNLARPVGAPISDHQGMIAEPGFSAVTTDVLAEAGIGALPFSAWSEPRPVMEKFSTHVESSHLVDLSQGPDHYFAQQQQQHHKYFKKMRQRARGVLRDYGSAEFVPNVRDHSLLNLLFSWKHQQFKRTGKLDVLRIQWVRALLETAFVSRHPHFQTVLFGYRIGNTWAAAELGLLANGVYHSWIAAYDDTFARVSPGLLLLHGVIEQAPELGITQIDLGRGHDHYKKYYASAYLPLKSGCLVQSGPAAGQRKLIFALCDSFARLPVGKLAGLPGRIDGSLEYIGACHPARFDQFRAFGGAILRTIKGRS